MQHRLHKSGSLLFQGIAFPGFGGITNSDRSEGDIHFAGFFVLRPDGAVVGHYYDPAGHDGRRMGRRLLCRGPVHEQLSVG